MEYHLFIRTSFTMQLRGKAPVTRDYLFSQKTLSPIMTKEQIAARIRSDKNLPADALLVVHGIYYYPNESDFTIDALNLK